MNGPSEFHCIGSAVGWSVTGRLGAIGCAAMTRITPRDAGGAPAGPH